MNTSENANKIIQDADRCMCDLRIKRLTIKMLIGAFAWFMFLPENWETLFWPLSLLIAWVADAIPSIGKMAAVSPMPGVVRGMLASSIILAPVAGMVVLFNDCIGIRIREFAAGRSIFRIVIAPLAVLFGLGLLGGFMFWLPFVEIKLSLTPTRWHLLLTAMLINCLFLAVGALWAGFVLAGLIHIIPIRLCNLVLIFFNLLGIENRKHG